MSVSLGMIPQPLEKSNSDGSRKQLADWLGWLDTKDDALR